MGGLIQRKEAPRYPAADKTNKEQREKISRGKGLNNEKKGGARLGIGGPVKPDPSTGGSKGPRHGPLNMAKEKRSRSVTLQKEWGRTC